MSRAPLHAVFNSLQDCSSAERRLDAHRRDEAPSSAIAGHRRTNSATLPLVRTALDLGSSELSGSHPQLRRHVSAAAASMAEAKGMLPPDVSGGGPGSINFGGGSKTNGGSPDRWFGRRQGGPPPAVPPLREIPRSPASPQVPLLCRCPRSASPTDLLLFVRLLSFRLTRSALCLWRRWCRRRL